MNRLNTTDRAIFDSLMCFLIPEDNHSELSGEPKKNQGRGLIDRKVFQSPSHPSSNYIAGRPKAALSFWFFSVFECGLLVFIVLVLYIIISKIDVKC